MPIETNIMCGMCRGILIIATPYASGFDYFSIADEVQFKFDRCFRSLHSHVSYFFSEKPDFLITNPRLYCSMANFRKNDYWSWQEHMWILTLFYLLVSSRLTTFRLLELGIHWDLSSTCWLVSTFCSIYRIVI